MKYIVDHIPRNTPCDRRPGFAMTARTITIHNTGNPDSSARNERAWLANPTNTRKASFHIAVDEREAVECLPLTENAWHAGDGGEGPGNRGSIGIEICESGDYAQTLRNAADLVAKMLKERGWGVNRLRRHWDWSGKVCPRLMYDGGKWTGWEKFKAMVAERLLPNNAVKVTVNGNPAPDGELIEGVTFVPIRVVGEGLGAVIGWDNTAKKPTINGRVVREAITRGSLAYVPVRAVCEELGATVDWNAAERRVEVQKS